MVNLSIVIIVLRCTPWTYFTNDGYQASLDLNKYIVRNEYLGTVGGDSIVNLKSDP